MIKIGNVNKFYNKGKSNELHVLNDISLSLPSKGVVALFGRSGCGKSTLFNLIGGLDKFEKGSISIDDLDITKNTDFIRNKYIGYIFQNYYLSNNESCFDNVANSLRLCGIQNEEVINELVMQALKNVGMEKFAKRTPDTLSGGQQQRIAIARAIVKNPKIILADEPTGNLDDNNTILVMDLLRKIGKEHLVLLITHEEKLVDYYCDQVINLSDGKVMSVRENESVQGLESKNKNDIYLGDLDKKEVELQNTTLEYYGEDLSSPIKIRLINNDGKLYIKVDDSRVKIIDSQSEIKVKEGKFIAKKHKRSSEEIIIKDIPQEEDAKYGKLFTFKDSFISGIKDFVFKKKKKLEKTLTFVLCLFSIVTVIFTSVFGTAFKSIENVNAQVNHNLFYVRATSDELVNKINESVELDENGIVYAQMLYNHRPNGEYTSFRMASFETSKPNYGNPGYYASYLDNSLVKDMKLLSGRKDNLTKNEIVITSQLADQIINQSTYGNIKKYDDLIGWFCDTLSSDNKSLIVTGIVEDNNIAVYVHHELLGDHIITQSQLPIKKASKLHLDVKKGEITYLSVRDSSTVINVGDKKSINGVEFVVSNVLKKIENYEAYLAVYYPEITILEQDYFDKVILNLNPSFDFENEEEYKETYSEIRNEYYFDYLEQYYSKYDDHLEHLFAFDTSNYHAWLYLRKGIELAKYNIMGSGMVYYASMKFKVENGRYPTIDEANEIDVEGYYEELNEIEKQYSNEYYSVEYERLNNDCYVLNDEDYYLVSKSTGKTDADISLTAYEYTPRYMLVYSNDAETTNEYLKSIISGADYGDEYRELISPQSNLEEKMKEVKQSIVTKLISIVALTAIMSLCMYFIMKSSVMNRIKEIGIYRAIGVSKKNFIFKFVIETLVLTSCTVLIGYLLSSGLIYVLTSLTPVMEEMLYYPWYLATILLVLLYGISLLCGVLPVLTLLRRTPSEILAKYDI